jgi:hypothetical protein
LRPRLLELCDLYSGGPRVPIRGASSLCTGPSRIFRDSFKRNQQNLLQQTIALKLPVLTRWTSHLGCLESILKSKVALKACVLEPEMAKKMRANKETSMRTKILGDDFWDDLAAAAHLLRPVLNVVLALESDAPRLSLVYQEYMQLYQHAQSEAVRTLPIGPQVERS